MHRDQRGSMRSVIIHLLIALIIGVPIASDAHLLLVPQEYPLIQNAIDGAASGDSILIESGIYAEALRIGDVSLTLIGADAPDTIGMIGTIIDPAELENSNELACLTLEGGDSVRLVQLWFRNGEAMHIGRATNDPGGIDNREGPRKLTLTSCRFDSVHFGIKGGIVVELERVIMHDMQQFCLTYGDSAQIIATDCRFEGAFRTYGMTAWSCSQFTRCSFSNSVSGELLIAGKDSLRIVDCDFGPAGSPCGSAVSIRPGSGTIIENNNFHDITTGGIALDIVEGPCSTIVDPDYRYAIIRNNIFRNIGHGSACQYGFPLELKCWSLESAFLGFVEGNVFIDCSSRGAHANAIYVSEGAADLDSNLFTNLLPNGCAAIYSLGVVTPETLTLRENAFDNLAYAINHSVGNEVTDARWNWWGDSSGPFDAVENPEGQGARVDPGVMYDPWLTTDPFDDTAEVAAGERTPEMISEYALSAYPNPFNATTTLEIEVAHTGDYDVVLYDVTGREAARVFSGRIDARATVSINASDFASGVYFVKLSGDEGMLAAEKLLLLK